MIAIRRSLVAVLFVAASCAKSSTSTPASGGSAGPTLGQVVRKNPNVITTAELRDPVIVPMDAEMAIRQLRPAFFRYGGPTSFDGSGGRVQISVDYGPLQSIDQLKTMSAMSFIEIRYLDPNNATNRFGLNANAGPAIVLLTNKQP
jgi:hypothetical protein